MKKKILLVFIILLITTLLSCYGELTITRYLESNQITAAIQSTDESLTNQDNVLLIYSRDESSKVNLCNEPGCWTIESIYPVDLLTNLDSRYKNDLHNLRASDWQLANDKGNLKMGPAPKGSPAGVYNGKWYPGDQDRGDVARILMYMAYFYEGLGVKLETMIDPHLALQWHREDPVDAFEEARNAAIKEIQGNNNLFITHRYYAIEIYGGPLVLYWVLATILAIGLIVFMIFLKTHKVKKRYYGYIITSYIAFSIINGLLWNWWLLIPLLAGIIGVEFYLSKKELQTNTST